MRIAQASLVAVGLSLFGLLAACSGGSSGGGGGSSGTGSSPVATADCTSRCESKATSCQAPADDAKEACGQLCDGRLTNDQLTCLEGKSCKELETGSLQSHCPASSGSSSGSSGSSSGTSGSSGSTTKFSCSLNGTCYKCEDSAGVQKCSLQTGPGPGCTKTDASYCE